MTGCVFVTMPLVGEVTLTRAETNFLKLNWRPVLAKLYRVTSCGTPLRVVTRIHLIRSVDMLVARLRRKIEPDPRVPRFLVTVPGIGYKLVAQPQCADVGQSGLKPNEPERRQVTALACKLVGAMGFAINLDPEDLVEEINPEFPGRGRRSNHRKWAEQTKPPWRLTKSWLSLGYPQAHEDDAERAVNAGTSMCGDKNRPARISQGRAAAGASGR